MHRTLSRAAFVVAIASVMTAVFFAVVEAGQILLPTRYPDSTDILLGLTGVLVGSWIIWRLGGYSHSS